MPSLFPGMDPYLEGDLWTSVHTQLGVEIVRQLVPLLRPRYIAIPEKRFVMPEPVPHVSVEIRDTGNRKLVTAIELLSPTNKRMGEGRDEYLEKRRRLLLSTAHLVEIDLLRAGERVPMRKPLPAAAYFILVSRAERRPMTDIWPVHLEDPLPPVPIPLLPGDADVPLDLQRAFGNVYDLGGYDLLVDYSRPPLNADQAAWANRLLNAVHERGF